LLLDGDVRVVEGAASKALEAADGVLEVGNLLRLGGLADVARLGAEAYQRPVVDLVSLRAEGAG